MNCPLCGDEVASMGYRSISGSGLGYRSISESGLTKREDIEALRTSKAIYCTCYECDKLFLFVNGRWFIWGIGKWVLIGYNKEKVIFT